MREAISIAAILIAFVYFLAFGSATFMALENEMHWALSLLALSGIIILRVWPALPVLAYVGAYSVWSWSWYMSLLLVLPVSFYIVSHYWTRLFDYVRRPALNKGV
jgi:hypothetical protein